jgi:predicted nucleic acid-binding protein
MALNLPSGTACFIDTNVLVYHLTNRESLGLACTEFFRRVELREISAFVSVPVLADVLHQVMLSEVGTRHGLDRAGLLRWVQRHPTQWGALSATAAACDQLERMPLGVLDLDVPLLREAVRMSADYGLLTSDAVILALMRRHDLTHLVTNDDDFDRVPGLTVWKPR